MTYRQWIILQIALLHYSRSLEAEEAPWDEDEDGDIPTPEEISNLANDVVGNLDHDRRSAAANTGEAGEDDE